MGLDITAYRKLTPAPEAELDGDGHPLDREKFHRISNAVLSWTEENWPGRSSGVVAGIYRAEESLDFRAGSYSGYGEWRDLLAKLVGYDSAETVWDTKPQGPFVELIDFADNEGVIGPVVATKLAKDFADHEDQIAAKNPGDWFMPLYRKWRKAFEMAADAGAVEFH